MGGVAESLGVRPAEVSTMRVEDLPELSRSVVKGSVVLAGGDLLSSGSCELYCVGVKDVMPYVMLSNLVSCLYFE